MASSINVITSVYNGSRFLDEYIKSVEEQLLKGFSLTIVDADSSDETLERLVKREWRKDIEVKVIPNEERIGLYKAWNIAIEASSADCPNLLAVSIQESMTAYLCAACGFLKQPETFL